MFESSKNWQGQVVDGKFALGEYLGGSKTGAVFLTQRGEASPQKAAIKLIPAVPATAELQLSVWRRCAQLAHPNLLGLFECGRCQIENTPLLYVVMEFAEENLAQILPERALTPAEARDMLTPVFDALLYLQAKGFVHRGIKPSNILACADRIKLSPDSVWPANEKSAPPREPTAYDPLESDTTPFSPAGQVWSLGITVMETLTQEIPSFQELQKGELPSAESLPAPFLGIVRGSLRVDAQQRDSLGDLANLLNPGSFKPAPAPPAAPTQPPASSAAPLSASAVSPLAVPLSPVPPLPREQMARPQASPLPPARKQRNSQSGSRFLIPAAVLAVVLIAIFAVAKLSHKSSDVPVSSSASAEQPARPAVQPLPSSPAAAVAPAAPPQKKATTQPPSESLQPASEKEPVAKQEPRASDAPMVAEPPTTDAANPSTTNGPRGDVLDQILPEVSQKARDTIRGKVLVTVRAHVDASGTVSSADLESSSSKFFGDLAVQAARRWQFQSPEADGQSLPSEWLLRFEFWPDDTKATAKQVKP